MTVHLLANKAWEASGRRIIIDQLNTVNGVVYHHVRSNSPCPIDSVNTMYLMEEEEEEDMSPFWQNQKLRKIKSVLLDEGMW